MASNTISTENKNIPFIVKTGSVNRGTIRTIHIQTSKDGERRSTLCGKILKLMDWRLVSQTEYRGQMMVCSRCEKRA